jgi:hypothetical protein
MCRRLRVQVFESQKVVVLMDFLGLDLALYYLAKDAVFAHQRRDISILWGLLASKST